MALTPQANAGIINHLDEYLTSNGFERSCREPCLYTKLITLPDGRKITIILLVYVDDILIACEIQTLIDETIKLLSNNFNTKILGFPTRFLGIDISIDANKNISLNQTLYLDSVLQQFKMHESKPVTTPMLKNNELSPLQKVTPPQFAYRSAIGCLMYLANNTRPDIMFAVHFLARFQNNPLDVHFVMIKRIFR